MKIAIQFTDADVVVEKDKTTGAITGVVLTPKLAEAAQTLPIMNFRVVNNKDKEFDQGAITVSGSTGKVARKSVTKGATVVAKIDQ